MLTRALKTILLLLAVCTLLAASNNNAKESSITEEASVKEQLLKDGYTMNKITTENGYTLELEFAKKEYNANGQPFSNDFYYGKKTLRQKLSFCVCHA